MAVAALDPSPPVSAAPRLPEPRGPLTAYLLEALRRPPRPGLRPPPIATADPTGDEDLQLALYVCYELHYRSFVEVDDRWEWEPALLGWRRQLEAVFESELRSAVPAHQVAGGDVEAALRSLLENSGGPSLSSFMEERGTLRQMREFAVHRSLYQLKEADPHTWGIPRLAGGPKAAFVHIQAEEYGDGVEQAMHSTLFASTLRSLGLDDTYGAYLDWVPAPTLATVNLVTLFGLHRRWRGALVGHLAAFEMTSVVPMGRYSRALQRLGVDAGGRHFYDVHVEADADHECAAADRLAGGLGRDQPDLAPDILFGAAALVWIEDVLARHLMGAWANGSSSLRRPL